MTADWRDQAVCGGRFDVFFGPEGETREARDTREAHAISICRPCPVRTPCLDEALSQPGQIGVAGGVGEERRKALRNAALHRQRRQERRRAALCPGGSLSLPASRSSLLLCAAFSRYGSGGTSPAPPRPCMRGGSRLRPRSASRRLRPVSRPRDYLGDLRRYYLPQARTKVSDVWHRVAGRHIQGARARLSNRGTCGTSSAGGGTCRAARGSGQVRTPSSATGSTGVRAGRTVTTSAWDREATGR